MNAHGLAEDESQRGLAEAGGAREKHVVERLFALQGGLDGEKEAVADFLLPDKVVKPGWTQAVVERGVALVEFL